MNSLKSAVLSFWFEDILTTGAFKPEVIGRWFAKNDEFDATIKNRFVKHILELRNDNAALAELQSDTDGLLASIIMFDQFPRNVFRGQADSFAFDHIALNASQKLPYEHQESQAHQQTSLKLFGELLNSIESSSPWKQFVAGALQYAKEHADIISRFGRYPHRNQILNRISTDEEVEFMMQHKGF